MIDALVETGLRAKLCCRLLGISSPGYYKYKKRPMSPTQMRRQWLTGLIREVHAASRQTYGSRRVHAELTLGMGVRVSERLVAVLMSQARIAGLPGPAKVKRLHGVATADDLVHRKFHRLSPNELWVTDITEHPTREGKVFLLRRDGYLPLRKSWAGRSTTRRTRISLSMLSTWRSRIANLPLAGSCMPTTESSSRRGRSRTRSELPG